MDDHKILFLFLDVTFFFHKFCKLSKEKMNEVVTELYFLAEKRGDGFGPFGKIY